MGKWHQDRMAVVYERAWTLQQLGVRGFRRAYLISTLLEHRVMEHEKLGAPVVIYSDLWLDAEKWSSLYRRVEEHVGGDHVARMRAVLDRLDLVVA